ncbi:hypothetical protein CFIO01_00182 [Colletotrichum fioriniae PJ7]|uniref:Uncharacterized protein n=1 Tax=Colletotrichum fioriniae PJ7 TaxID=1445577 RepID=A0A010RCW3_9PEZI|nr:hypothetical protein CFIO01_00182 [Colletotrichum fioriniae PJ7]
MAPPRTSNALASNDTKCAATTTENVMEPVRVAPLVDKMVIVFETIIAHLRGLTLDFFHEKYDLIQAYKKLKRWSNDYMVPIGDLDSIATVLCSRLADPSLWAVWAQRRPFEYLITKVRELREEMERTKGAYCDPDCQSLVPLYRTVTNEDVRHKITELADDPAVKHWITLNYTALDDSVNQVIANLIDEQDNEWKEAWAKAVLNEFGQIYESIVRDIDYLEGLRALMKILPADAAGEKQRPVSFSRRCFGRRK